MSRKRITLAILTVTLFAMTSFTAGQAAGEDIKYPVRPITMVVPYAAGGGTDINARLVASYMEKKLGQPIAVVNKTGGGGAIGTRQIALSDPDGYNLGIISYPDAPVISALRGKEAGFTNEDLVVLGTFTSSPNVLAIRKDGPYKTFDEFVAYAKKNPGKISVSVPSAAHKLGVLELEEALKIDLNPIMFKSGNEAMNNLLGGHVMATFCAVQFALPVHGKQIVVIASAGEKRIKKLSDVPTLKEKGINVVNLASRIICVPKGVPEAIRKKLVGVLEELRKDQELAAKVDGTGEVYDPKIGAELDKYYKATNEAIARAVEKNKKAFAE
jgi:tripartite-type tricarboxylate transporter receptor subunit TctC